VTSTSISYGIGFVCLIVVAALVRVGRFPGLAKAVEQGRDVVAASTWAFVAAGLGALLGALYLIQRAYPGDPNVYTSIRVVVMAAMVAVVVRIILLFR